MEVRILPTAPILSLDIDRSHGYRWWVFDGGEMFRTVAAALIGVLILVFLLGRHSAGCGCKYRLEIKVVSDGGTKTP